MRYKLQHNKKSKILFHEQMLLVILTVKKIVWTFYKKGLQKINQTELRVKKVIKRKGDKLYISWKVYDNSVNSLRKKILFYKMSCFPEPFQHAINKIKIELDLDNYATKSDLKSATCFVTSKFAYNADLVSLKSDVDDFDALKTVLVDLNKLSNAVKNDVVKMTVTIN